jgi:hypothetical protein
MGFGQSACGSWATLPSLFSLCYDNVAAATFRMRRAQRCLHHVKAALLDEQDDVAVMCKPPMLLSLNKILSRHGGL